MSPQTALLQLHQATHSHSSQLGDDRHKAGTGSVITSLQSQTGPKINASEGINRREKKAWTLRGQDCFVFPKAISLFTRRLLFQKNTGPVTLPRKNDISNGQISGVCVMLEEGRCVERDHTASCLASFLQQ